MEAAVEQAEEQITADLPDPPRMPRPLGRLGDPLDALTRRLGLIGGQPVRADGDGAIRVRIGGHTPIHDALAVPAVRRTGIDRDHHPAQQQRELTGGQPGCPRHRHRADALHLPGCQVDQILAEHPHPRPIHLPGQPRREQLRHGVHHRLGQIVLGVGRPPGPAQRRPGLVAGVAVRLVLARHLAGRAHPAAAGQLGQGRRHPGLLVAQLPVLRGEQLQHAVVGYPRQRHRAQQGGQLRAGGHRRQPSRNLHHLRHGSNIHSAADNNGRPGEGAISPGSRAGPPNPSWPGSMTRYGQDRAATDLGAGPGHRRGACGGNPGDQS